MAKRKTNGSIAPPESACAASHRRHRQRGGPVEVAESRRGRAATAWSSWSSACSSAVCLHQRLFPALAWRLAFLRPAGFPLRHLPARQCAGRLRGFGRLRGTGEVRMHDLAAVGQHGRLDQFVVAVDRELLGRLVDHRLEEGEEVPGVEQRGRGRDAARHVEVADDLDAVGGGDDLAGLRAFDIAAALDREVDDHRARLHRGDHRRRHQLRRRPAGDQRGGDDDVLLGDVLGRQRRLLGLVFLRHFLGVAAGRLGRLELLVLDCEELGAERGDLLLGGRTHVGGGDDGAKPPRRGDRLQAGDADAHDEHLGRRHRAGRRHHHRQRAVIFGRRVDHRLVAGEVGLAGQHVHRLRAGDARHEFHGEGASRRPWPAPPDAASLP